MRGGLLVDSLVLGMSAAERAYTRRGWTEIEQMRGH